MDAENLFLYSLILILQFTFCTSMDTMSFNHTIKDGDLLISNGNIFAFGFFSPGKSQYRYLGIWYRKIPQLTAVWVANGNDPINGSSGVLSINQYGNLILYGNHDQNVPIWSTNVSFEITAGNCTAQLLDSGNLVLVQGRSKTYVWQSFDYPTNMMLQGMKLGVNRRTGQDLFLTSWRSADDPGSGNYTFRLNPNGSPQFFLYQGANPIWRTSPWPWKSAYVYNYSFVNNEDYIYFSYTSFDDASVILIGAVVDHYGMLRTLTWLEGESQWKEFSTSPKYRCDSYGQCGPFSMCDPTNVNRFVCSCLPGYEPRSPRNWFVRDGSDGCVRKRLKTSSVCLHGEGFVKVENVFLPDTSKAVWVNMSMSRINCEKECRRKCSCTAYASVPIPGKGMGCLAWYGELIDTIYDRIDTYDLYVRVDALELAERARKSKGSLEMKEKLGIIILSIASAWLVISKSIYLWLSQSRRKDILEANESKSPTDLVFFNLSTVLAATDNFSAARKLGQGGFGSVYKGELPNGQEIAVKRLSKNSGQGIEEFRNEVILTAKLQHRNLVKLLGCCTQGGEPILIYEYLSNKGLDSFLFDKTRRSVLVWRKRYNIIVGIARGILYLHQDSRLRIVHRDLKCSNILLDAEMNPKISDFGMARLFKGDQTEDNTNKLMGTYGYMSPEYATLGKYSVKSDVFSFGVILLEIVSGKKNNSFCSEELSLTLIGHVWELWRGGKALEIVESSVMENYNSNEALRCIQIGLLCVQENATDRPSMLEVVLMLNSERALPPPKQPAFIFKKSCINPKSSSSGERASSVNEITITALSTR